MRPTAVRRALAALVILATSTLGLALPALAGTGSLELVASSAEDQWDGYISFTDDGSKVAFVSRADGQVYVRDVATGTDTLVSTPDGVIKANAPAWRFPGSFHPEISPGGQFVTFTSLATNLSPADTDLREDVYIKNLATGELKLVSTTSAGQKGNLASHGPAPVSDTGVVLFVSRAGNFPPVVSPLPPECADPESTACLEAEIYVKDTVSGALTLVSLGSRGDYMDAMTSVPQFGDISADGTVVAFGTGDTLTPEDQDTFGAPDVVVRNLVTDVVTLASNERPAGPGAGFYLPSLSSDGSVVAFQGNILGQEHVWVRDLSAPGSVPALVSSSTAGVSGNDISQTARVAPDGASVAFASRSTNLDPSDTDAFDDVYVKNLASGALTLVSQTDDGTKGNGYSYPTQVLAGSRIAFESGSTNLNPAVGRLGEYGYFIKTLAAAPPPPPPNPDANGDGVADVLQPAGTAAGAFVDSSTSPPTTGSIVDAGGLTVTVTDAALPDGVLVTVDAGTGRATMSVCGMTVKIPAGGSAVLTCGSLVVRSVAGPVTVEVDGGFFVVTVAEGASVKVTDTAAGVELRDVDGVVTLATRGGAPQPVAPGAGPAAFNAWVATGFSSPVDNGGVLNRMKAGRAVPLKWYVADATGAPVTDLATATVSLAHYDCGLATTTDTVEQTTAGGSGLQNLGGGNYQLNWKTSTAWANSCKTMRLDLGGGVVLTALFQFTK